MGNTISKDTFENNEYDWTILSLHSINNLIGCYEIIVKYNDGYKSKNSYKIKIMRTFSSIPENDYIHRMYQSNVEIFYFKKDDVEWRPISDFKIPYEEFELGKKFNKLTNEGAFLEDEEYKKSLNKELSIELIYYLIEEVEELNYMFK